MREISLHILDLAQNSVKADAGLIEILVKVSEAENIVEFSISDNGRGMSAEQISAVTDPFFTSRTERRVGLGVPLCKLACEQAGGRFDITSGKNTGTKVYGSFLFNHIDRQPMGDLAGTVLYTATADEAADVVFHFKADGYEYDFDTREIKNALSGVPISNPDVMEYLKGELSEINLYMEDYHEKLG
jgi:hypothetical protein